MANIPAEPRRHVAIEKIYLKDLSFVSPKTPDVFSTDVNVENLLNIQSTNAEINPEHVEVTLTVAVKAVAGQDTIFRVDVVQAGVFRITGYTPEERVEIVGRFCPETLFPFARKAIDDAARKGGFPHVLLRPLDFDALFDQNMRERTEPTATV